MNPRDFLKVAATLATARGESAPARRRTSIGRAYFAAYNVAAEVLGAMGAPPFDNPEGHNQAIRLLQVSGDEELRAIGMLLSSLRTDRNHADYAMSRPDVETMTKAQLATETAQQIVADLDAFLADPSRRGLAEPLIQGFYERSYRTRSSD